MGTFLASIFLNHARAPLARASERFGRNLMGDGVRALSRDHLIGAVDGAIDEVARAVSMPRERVEGMVPHDQLLAQATRVSAAQEEALAAIRRFDFTVVAFTQLAPRASASTHLLDLSRHFARDRYIAEPLGVLASELAAWEERLSEACARLAADTSLEKTWRAKRMLRAILAWSVVGLVAVVLGGGLLLLRHAQEERRRKEEEAGRAEMAVKQALIRVDEIASAKDPCTPTDPTPEDRAHATAEQRKKLEARRTRCEEETRRRARDVRCAEVGASVGKGDVQPSPDVPAEAVEILHRVATSTLEPADLTPRDAAIPCRGTPTEARVWSALARAAAPAASVWGRAEGVSPQLVPLVSKGDSILTKASQLSLSFRAETLARKAVVGGAAADAPRARTLCDLKAALGMPLALGCQGLAKMAK